jgi:hypothetical protein
MSGKKKKMKYVESGQETKSANDDIKKNVTT